ncbi:MAG: hypothetical protein R2730_01985 [Chitinophagales bacterium]
MKTKYLLLAVLVIECFSNVLLAQSNHSSPKAILSFVNASEDDAVENLGNGQTSIGNVDLSLVSSDHNEQLIGVRFTNLNIPQGAVVSSARLVYNVDQLKDGWNELEIYAENTDHASPFEQTIGNITNRTKTQATIKLDNKAKWTNINGSITSPNIAEVIQEIVNRPGWMEMNSIALVVKGSGGNTAIAYDGNPNLPPMLIVNYMESKNTFTNVFLNNSISSPNNIAPQ